MKQLGKMTDAYRADSGYRPFLISVLLISAAYALYQGVLDNYLARAAAMTEFDRGLTEFFREMPGLFLVLILAVLYRFSAESIYKTGGVILLGGMVLQSLVRPEKALVILAMFIYSLGDHMQLGMRSTLSLSYAKTGRGGEALGETNSIHEIGKVTGFLAVTAALLLLKGEEPYKLFFRVAAAIIAVGVLISFRMTGASETDSSKRRFYFRRKFSKYYMLEVFYGARKQVFFTFGPYTLILFYGANATVISLLFCVSAIACFFMSPVVGRIIDRLGYKIVMISDTLILVIVCFFYGFAHHIFPRDVAFVICCVNYVLDSVISLASMASSVYVQDISDSREEMMATISTGLSVNHMITILIALSGGWIWQKLGMEVLFVISAILGLCNSAYAASIKKKPAQP